MAKSTNSISSLSTERHVIAGAVTCSVLLILAIVFMATESFTATSTDTEIPATGIDDVKASESIEFRGYKETKAATAAKSKQASSPQHNANSNNVTTVGDAKVLTNESDRQADSNDKNDAAHDSKNEATIDEQNESKDTVEDNSKETDIPSPEEVKAQIDRIRQVLISGEMKLTIQIDESVNPYHLRNLAAGFLVRTPSLEIALDQSLTETSVHLEKVFALPLQESRMTSDLRGRIERLASGIDRARVRLVFDSEAKAKLCRAIAGALTKQQAAKTTAVVVLMYRENHSVNFTVIEEGE